jgi:hypothetical protein
MGARLVKTIVLLAGVAIWSWAGVALLDAAYELRKYGSPYGLVDLQLAVDEGTAQAVLESWAVEAGTDVFVRARTYALRDVAWVVGGMLIITAALLLLRSPLRRLRATSTGMRAADALAGLLDRVTPAAVVATVTGAGAGVIADLIHRAALATAKDRGPAAAVGGMTTLAGVLSHAMLVLTALGLAVLVLGTLYVLARNRSPLAKDFFAVVRVTRFSVLTVAAVGLGMCVPDQLRDAFRALEEGHWLRIVIMEIVLIVWAFTVWYAARFLLYVNFETEQAFGEAQPELRRELWGERQWPRILGVAAFLVFALATWLAYRDGADSREVAYPGLVVLSVVNVILGGAFWAFTYVRRAIVRSLMGRFESPRGLAYRDMPSTVRWLVRGAVTVVTVLWLLVFWAPQPLAPHLGSVTLLLGAAITITMAGSAVVWVGERAKLPAVSILAALAVIFSFINDNHAVRRLPDASRPPRIELVSHVTDWYRWIDRTYPGEKEHPLFVVSASGGGIRAAYWTATVLARLQDLNPAFADHTLLVSSVSGGSLGSVVFANLADTTVAGGAWRGRHASFGSRAYPECPYPAQAPGKYQALAAALLARDFLAPAAASMLYGDFLARLLPYSLLSDRAEALEVSWERAWDAVKRRPPADLTSPLWDGSPLERSFDALYPAEALTSEGPRGARHIPLVLLNGTIVESGARILVSHLQHPDAFKGDLENAFDHRNAPMRMSTAALMSARFTYVSPAGTYAPGTHVVDGGYFENSGAATALQWWGYVEDTVDDLNKKRRRGAGEIRPVFVYIDNAPPARARPASGEPTTRRTETKSRAPRILPEMSAPVDALLAAREAHALESKTRAIATFVEFVAVDTSLGLSAAPLGWVLSRSAQTTLDRALCRNAEQVAEIVEMLPKPR